jgi:hypothetical protein
MSKAVGFLWLPVLVAAALILSRRWPIGMRRASRGLAISVGLAVVCVVITGLAHGSNVAATIHRWLSHGLLVWAWSVILPSIGIALVGARSRPIVALMRTFGLSLLLVVLFVASLTGYLGPSRGPIDALSLARFRMLHFRLWPTVSIVLISAWYYQPKAERRPWSRSGGAISSDC